MLSVGVIGLGNIAEKAYLPLYTGLQGDAQWFLESRDLAKLTRIANQYHMVAAGTDLAALDALKLDAVMIHSATEAHEELVRHFLTRDVHVFVDKPLATTPEAVTGLYLLATEHRKLLTVGFNRRFAPMMQDLIALPNKNAIRVTKNRVDGARPVREAIFDELIHPLDTALAIAGFPDEPKARYALHTDGKGNLEQASVTFMAAGIRGTAELNLVAGTNLEEATVTTTAGITRVVDLARSQTYAGTTMTEKVAPDWQPMLRTRGFEPMVDAFLAAVANQGANPVSPATSKVTHQILTDLVAQLD